MMSYVVVSRAGSSSADKSSKLWLQHSTYENIKLEENIRNGGTLGRRGLEWMKCGGQRYATFKIGMLLYNSFQTLPKDSKMQDFLNCNARTNGRWTKEEHLKFLEGLRIYGKNWKKIEQLVDTRTGSQIRSHAQKFFLKSPGSEAAEIYDYSPASADIQEQHSQNTENSKTLSERTLRRDDLSYYLVRIVEYSSGRTDLDFWEGLVDCKGASEPSKQPEQKNSFISVEDDQSCSSFEKPPQKKVKI